MKRLVQSTIMSNNFKFALPAVCLKQTWAPIDRSSGVEMSVALRRSCGQKSSPFYILLPYLLLGSVAGVVIQHCGSTQKSLQECPQTRVISTPNEKNRRFRAAAVRDPSGRWLFLVSMMKRWSGGCLEYCNGFHLENQQTQKNLESFPCHGRNCLLKRPGFESQCTMLPGVLQFFLFFSRLVASKRDWFDVDLPWVGKFNIRFWNAIPVEIVPIKNHCASESTNHPPKPNCWSKSVFPITFLTREPLQVGVRYDTWN